MKAAKLQEQVIRGGVLDYPVMLNVWEVTLRFIEKHHSKEPSHDEVLEYVGVLEDEELKTAKLRDLRQRAQAEDVAERRRAHRRRCFWDNGCAGEHDSEQRRLNADRAYRQLG